MSVTTEIIAEQIAALREKLISKKKSGDDISDLESRISELSKQLMSAVSLNENKNILKG